MTAVSTRVRAWLGPTNTGKTHRAVRAMLAHRSGMIGLPLRLLAREVYDRIVAEKGDAHVALVTGEEKRVPSDPRWYVCTVEAMPLDRRVAFLAVDEVQLAGDRNRGHVFTDRLLHARGTLETWFLGSEIIRPLLERLVPGIEIDTAPRLSTLTYAGERKLTSLPRRSAVVAFSADQVYEQAERIRAVHGGAAVVLGALSPRTRNAQVALYQSGEVGHLVATDAIGMGLNMDLDHVAFSALRKFDGRGHRDLSSAEVAQIAGRAGRYTTDGSFGATRELGPLPEDLVQAVEQHRFPSLERLYWRNSRLDYTSPDALLRSLSRPPPHPFLVPCHQEDDQLALEALLADPAVHARVTGRPEALSRLWEVCQVPDYRKDLTGAHVSLLAQIAARWIDAEPLPTDFLTERLDRLDRPDGDIDTLMARIAWIRTWTFVCHQRGWAEDPAGLQAHAAAIEERLSDALHAGLTQRFVDRRMLLVTGAGPAIEGRVDVVGDEVRAGDLPLGRLVDVSLVPASGVTSRRLLAGVRRALASEAMRRLSELESAPDAAIDVDGRGRIVFGGQAWARLVVGAHPTEPNLKLLHLDLLEPPARERVRARLLAWMRRWVDELGSSLTRAAADGLSRAGDTVVYQLRRSLGVIDLPDVPAVNDLSDDDRKRLAKLDVRIGTRSVYIQTALKLPAMRRKAILFSVFDRREAPSAAPPNGPTSVALEGADAPLLRFLGYRVVGRRWVRVDMVERVLAEARTWARDGGVRQLAPMLGWLGCGAEDAVLVLADIGYDVTRDGEYGVTLAKRARPPRSARGMNRRRRG